MDTSELVKRIFSCSREVGYDTSSSNIRLSANDSTVFMNIPIDGEEVELPTFVINSIASQWFSVPEDANNITAVLKKSTRITFYRSFNRGIEDILLHKYLPRHLIKTDFTKFQGNYWGMNGAMFDGNLNPVVIFSWKLKKEGTNLSCVQPILRISKECFISCDDTLKRFIVNKILPAALGNKVYNSEWRELYDVKVEIGEFPYSFRRVDRPSISVDNQKLKNLVLNHMDEIAV